MTVGKTIGDQMIALREEKAALEEIVALKRPTAISIKPGVDIAGIQPEMSLALPIIASAFHQFGVECVITSGKEGKHGRNSLHYVGFALDFRTRDLTEADQAVMHILVIKRLSSQFDVVLEKDHLHVEFQPEGVRG